MRKVEDRLVIGIGVWFKQPKSHDKELVVLQAGERQVPARIAPPGSPASENCDAAFLVCSTPCADALKEAIEDDLQLSVVH